jgi:hypothetical protein
MTVGGNRCAAQRVVGTIRLGGKPEFAVSAGDGMLYAEMMLTGWPRSLGDQGTA